MTGPGGCGGLNSTQEGSLARSAPLLGSCSYTVVTATTVSITVTLRWWDAAQGAWRSGRLASAPAPPETSSPLRGVVYMLPPPPTPLQKESAERPEASASLG